MLTAQILNSEAELNSFDVIGTKEFMAGEAFKLVMRLQQVQRKDELRFVVPSPTSPAVTITTLHFNNKDGTTLDKIADFMVDDRSIWSVDITSDESEDLVSGNFTFDIDVTGDGTQIIKGYVQNGLSLVITGSCC